MKVKRFTDRFSVYMFLFLFPRVKTILFYLYIKQDKIIDYSRIKQKCR
jgi:hypothetical protein